MVISFISFKGGVGKSTLAQNTAVCLAQRGHRIALVDTDPTASTLSWYEARETSDIEAIHHDDSKTITTLIKKLESKFDFVIIDCPPAINPITTKILLVADLNMIPILPSGSDTWTTEKFLEHIERVRTETNMSIHACIVVNRFSPRVRLHQDFMEVLKEYSSAYQIDLAETTIKNRAAFQYANSDGCGVVEYNDKKAAHEVESLTNEMVA